MIFKIYCFVQILILQVTFAQYQASYGQNVPNYLASTQEIKRRCPRQVNSLPANMAINTNTALNGLNNVEPVPAAFQNMRSGMGANEFLPNVNKMHLNTQNPLFNNLANNGLSPNFNGLTNANSFGGNGFLNSNSMQYGNGLPMNNSPQNYFNGQMNNPVPNWNNFPRGGGFLNGNGMLNTNVPTNNWLQNRNNQLTPNFPQNVFPANNDLLNSFKPSNINESPGFYNCNNLPLGNNNLMVNNVPGNNLLNSNINPFNVNSNMPLHTIMPSTSNMPGNAINNGIPFLNNNRFLNNFSPANGNSMPMFGMQTNNLAVVDNLQHDVNKLASEHNMIHSTLPSLSNLQQENLFGLTNNLNLANNFEMDNFVNLPMMSGVQANSLPNNINNLCL